MLSLPIKRKIALWVSIMYNFLIYFFLTSAFNGCCLITSGLWCPRCMSGSSYVSDCPTGITLGSNAFLDGVLHGRKFWTFLLCLKISKKNVKFLFRKEFFHRICSFIINFQYQAMNIQKMNESSNRIFPFFHYNPSSHSYIELYSFM